MKKLLTLSILGLLLVGCDDETTQQTTSSDQTQTVTVEEPKIQAAQPESVIENIAFTKNEKGTVIFNNVPDMFVAFSSYDKEDNNIKVISENPLHIQLNPNIFKLEDDKDTVQMIEQEFISAIYKIFTHTNINEFILEMLPVDIKTEKPLHKKFNRKIKITRERALTVLQNFSPAKSFDQLVNFNEQEKYNIIGLSPSKLASKFNNNKYSDFIFKALSTGKIDIPKQEVIIPLNIDMKIIQERLAMADIITSIEPRDLTNGKKAYDIKLSKIVMIEGIGNSQNNVESLSLQFGMVSEPKIIIDTVAGFGVSSFVMPNPDKTFKEINKMVEKAGKQMKKKDIVEITSNVGDITLQLKVFKNMGGLSYLTFKKVEWKPVDFSVEE
ncbi:hypothetical protein RO21_05575 [[Actinobacillus] muris]|uniref:Lipoprotein n=1 Tax=Muribacter muris TaxID=67855 RepID=A0A0J5P575_9PAST|nr:hypothetical protein [Muribacter muris]KMK51568.1 hypothetical protein RO21_05575 [[Actinobacillus] muris] [Muribacter muris]MBF0786215.1 hypothetical protein [Muribacter muris]MBF0826452.1 hypothetical protein [Muribacter muris]TFV07577.1 hypothetical protein E4T80_12150 [Muribacter muris]